MRHAVLRLLPDFNRRAVEMRLPVRVVVVLVRVEIFIGMLGDKPTAFVVCAVRTLQRIRLDDFRAVEPHQLLALLRRVRGKAQRNLVSHGGPQRGIRNPKRNQ